MSEAVRIGWCSNVLQSATAAALVAELESIYDVIPAETPLGLWLPQSMLGSDLQPLQRWLAHTDTPLLGLNAFPIDRFHDAVVKTAVYRPHWGDPARAAYTIQAATCLAGLLGPGSSAGLTTVPIGWRSDTIDLTAACRNIRAVCDRLDAIAQETGTTLHLAIEPEPGCIVDTAGALATLVTDHGLEDLAARGTLRACLDACHLAVMHESPSDAVSSLAAAGISIGRLQLSSAPEARDAGHEAMLHLREPRWMHQTSILRDGHVTFFDDLPDADDAPRAGIWRTHLHVPIHLERIGSLHTTQQTIDELLAATSSLDDRPAIEVETYAWSVLPDEARGNTLAEDIADELAWARSLVERRR
jgi:sugar phosphate isomerase/epimerase